MHEFSKNLLSILYHLVSKDIISKVSCVLSVIFMLTLSYVAVWCLSGFSVLRSCFGRPGNHRNNDVVEDDVTVEEDVPFQEVVPWKNWNYKM